MIPTKPTKNGPVDTAQGTDAKSYLEREKQKKINLKKQALKGLEDVASSKEKEQLSTVLESIVDMIIEQEVEASQDDLFGEYLFGQNRVTPKAKQEPNTQEETEFLDALVSWIVDEYGTPLQGWFPKVWGMVQDGKYTEMLKPDEGRAVYRLIRGFEAAKSLGVQNNPIYKEKMEIIRNGENSELPNAYNGKAFPVEVSTLSPVKRQIQSWGIYPLKLNKFMKPGEPAILLKTFPSNSNGKFLVNPNTFINEFGFAHNIGNSEIKSMVAYLEEEGEVISLGNVRIVGAAAVFMPMDRIGVAEQRKILSQMYNLLENE